MEYTITIDLNTMSVKSDVYKNNAKTQPYQHIVFDVNKDNPSSTALQYIIDDDGRTLEHYQNLDKIESVFAADVDKVFGNIIKLNIALNNAFDDSFIATFSSNYGIAVDNETINDIKSYHSLVQFFYACKRGIVIAYTLLRLQQSLFPEETKDIKKLKEKEQELRSFLTDSVELIMNTGEFVNNISSDNNAP